MEQQNKDQKKDGTEGDRVSGKLVFFGAAVGAITGLFLLKNPTLGMGLGAAIGLIVGIMMDLPKKKTS